MPRRAKPDTPASSSNQASLESLLAQASNGDRDAFLEIYDRTAPRILGVIERILGAHPHGEEILEDVFAELWRTSRSLGSRSISVAAWLTFRARNAALAHQSAPPQNSRRSSPSCVESPRRRKISETSSDMLAWLPDAGAIGRIEQRRPLLVKVLGQLPREQLKALELVLFGANDEVEVANQLGEPLARVKAELRAAIRFLRHRRRAVVGSWAVNI